MLDSLLELFCAINNISEQDIKGRSRANGLPLFRQVFCYLMRKELHFKLQSIANVVGYNHTVVLYSIDKINNCLSMPKYFSNVKRMVETFLAVYNQSTEEARLTESDHTTPEMAEMKSCRGLDRSLLRK